ncbi:Zn-ribbon domain-containing OB-fold protein [Nocardia inohanensis]|uniref:Zn-ribbon domain-containing OB-fold protein n=1 Tax=Nocardia inohanensis TaxID=209246 RepID=UPI0008330336|nr:OB-fold domain-containing protein [Nocardia inohanensis]
MSGIDRGAAGWPVMRRDGKSAEFFDAARRGEVAIKKCAGCGVALAPEAMVCTDCAGTELTWVTASGAGTLITWTVVHKAPNRAYQELVPYTVGVVELAEGPWLYAAILGEPSAGAALRADFVHPADGESYPVWVVGDGEPV